MILENCLKFIQESVVTWKSEVTVLRNKVGEMAREKTEVGEALETACWNAGKLKEELEKSRVACRSLENNNKGLEVALELSRRNYAGLETKCRNLENAKVASEYLLETAKGERGFPLLRENETLRKMLCRARNENVVWKEWAKKRLAEAEAGGGEEVKA